MLTWIKLRELIDNMTPEQQTDSVTLYDSNEDEFHCGGELKFATNDEDDDSASIIGDKAGYLTF